MTLARTITSADSTADRLAFAAAREICRKYARGFYFACMFLPRHKRDAAYAVHGFCRMIEEAIDQPAPEDGSGGCSGDSLASRLAMFGDKLSEIYENRLELPAPEFRTPEQHVLHAFSLVAHRFEIPRQYLMDLAEGCRMDLTISRYATWNSLAKYCEHSGGAGALIMSCILGLTHSEAGKSAEKMGNAIRLTAILRDVKEDFAGGRIYIPLEDLARFKYSERELATGAVNENFRELMRFEISRARQMYRDAAEGLCWLAGDGSRLTASVIAVMHCGTLDAIETQDYDVFTKRARLSFAQTMSRLPRAWKLARREPGEPAPRVF